MLVSVVRVRVKATDFQAHGLLCLRNATSCALQAGSVQSCKRSLAVRRLLTSALSARFASAAPQWPAPEGRLQSEA